jgi:hypothetical protein
MCSHVKSSKVPVAFHCAKTSGPQQTNIHAALPPDRPSSKSLADSLNVLQTLANPIKSFIPITPAFVKPARQMLKRPQSPEIPHNLFPSLATSPIPFQPSQLPPTNQIDRSALQTNPSPAPRLSAKSPIRPSHGLVGCRLRGCRFRGCCFGALGGLFGLCRMVGA